MRNPNGYGTVYKLSGNRRKPYIARVTVGWDLDLEKNTSTQKCKTIGYYATRKEAMVALANYNENPYDIDSAKTTFSDLYHWFIEQPKIQRLSQSSMRAYQTAFKRCGPVEHMVFSEIKKLHLQGCIDEIDDAGYPTRKKVKLLFHQLYKLAGEMDITDKDYSQYVDCGVNDSKSKKLPFTEDEILLIKKHAMRVDYLDTVLILLYTGMRVSEMLDIKTCDVFLDDGYMRGGNKTYAGINRVIPIHSLIFPIIEKYYNSDNEYLLNTKRGKMSYANYRDSYFDKFMVALDMNHLPHECRHTFISRMDSAGCNPMVLKRIVGHAGSGITEQVYTHKGIEELKKGIELID